MPKANEYSNFEYSFVCLSYGDYCSDIVDSRLVLFCGASARFVADGGFFIGVGFVDKKQCQFGNKRAQLQFGFRVFSRTRVNQRSFDGVLRAVFRGAFQRRQNVRKAQCVSAIKHREPNCRLIRACPNHAMPDVSCDIQTIANIEYSIFALTFKA